VFAAYLAAVARLNKLTVAKCPPLRGLKILGEAHPAELGLPSLVREAFGPQLLLVAVTSLASTRLAQEFAHLTELHEVSYIELPEVLQCTKLA